MFCDSKGKNFRIFLSCTIFLFSISLNNKIFKMRLLFTSFLFLTIFQLKAQIFAGEWKGYYTHDKGDFFVPSENPIIYIIIDSSNKAKSYTTFKIKSREDTIIVRMMSFEKTDNNSIKLVELKDSLPNGSNEGLQTMFLTLKRQKSLTLVGRWETPSYPGYKGKVILSKAPKQSYNKSIAARGTGS